jgi:hypothetical protein
MDKIIYLMTEIQEKSEGGELAPKVSFKEQGIKIRMKLLNNSEVEPVDTNKIVNFEVNDDIISITISDKVTGRKESFNGMRTSLCFEKKDCYGNGICNKRAECICAKGKHGVNCQLDHGDHYSKGRADKNSTGLFLD